MRTIITPAEVVEYAFGPAGAALRRPQTEAATEAAERIYLVPALGEELCAALRDGRYPELLERVKPALALYVRSLLLPELAVQAGAGGVGRVEGDTFRAASAGEVRELAASARRQAGALTEGALGILRASPQDYPEWKAADGRGAVMRCGVLLGPETARR